MITNAIQLDRAPHQLATLRGMLEAMRRDTLKHSPGAFPLIAEGYVRRINLLQEEIDAYLRQHPAEAPISGQKTPGLRDPINDLTIDEKIG